MARQLTFPFVFEEKKPDLRKHEEILRNIKTPICGLKNVNKCKTHSEECKLYCKKELTNKEG